MTITENRLPDVARADAGIALVGYWTVRTPERQRAAVDAGIAACKRAPWPEGLISFSAFASTDGETVLTYSQWTGDEAVAEFRRGPLPMTLVREVEDAVPGLERSQPISYRLYRSSVRDGAPVPGCVVIVSVEFDGPDEARQRKWVDTVFEALEAETKLHPGGISGHFHISTDGTRVLNYAEWTSEEAHRDALERSGQGSVGSGPKWRDVHRFPGVRSSAVKRYHLYRSLAEAPTVGIRN
jgi:hypothetical protein